LSATVARVPRARGHDQSRRYAYVIGVDGGNSKTDVVIADADGAVLARTRGPGVESPLADPSGWRHTLLSLVDEARGLAGLDPDSRAGCAAYYLANVDLPAERRAAARMLTGATPAALTIVHNDAVAVLRAGATRPWGVAVVAGAGVNAVGIHPSGRIARFLAFGDYTGDFGGGHHLGVQALGAAVRHRDGRGPATMLTTAVPDHFGLRTPEEVAIAVHDSAIAYSDLHVLAPVVVAAAGAGDPVATRLMTEFSDEVAVMAIALIRRLRLVRTDVEVILGGSVLQTAEPALIDRVVAAVATVAPRAQLSVLTLPPVFGALVDAYDQVGAPPSTVDLLRKSLAEFAGAHSVRADLGDVQP
jgi:N-acetylglucosamine kinase-like BadF-type ATPase